MVNFWRELRLISYKANTAIVVEFVVRKSKVIWIFGDLNSRPKKNKV